MFLNIKELKSHMEKYHQNSYRRFARALEVEVSQLHRIINKKSKAGVLFLGRLHKYCKKNELEFNDFIFFEENVNCS